MQTEKRPVSLCVSLLVHYQCSIQELVIFNTHPNRSLMHPITYIGLTQVKPHQIPGNLLWNDLFPVLFFPNLCRMHSIKDRIQSQQQYLQAFWLETYTVPDESFRLVFKIYLFAIYLKLTIKIYEKLQKACI